MLKRFLIAAIIALCAMAPKGPALAAATLLPNGEQCFQATTGTTGMVGALGTVTGGSGGTAGTYAGVALTGGSGSGATANIVVAGGAVTAVTILNPGIQYAVGDTLSAASGNIGGTSGFSVPVNSISINSSLAGGKVYFYVPNTSSFKSTWSNQSQSAQNTNPVQLDQNGCATIYGTGSYRQVLQDSLGNTVWDKLTTDTSANNNTFWAGLASGTPNAITVIDPGFNGTDGSVIQFVALSTNTSTATLNPSSFGAVSIVKATTGGPVALVGGEIIAGNVISVLYSATANTFTLLNPPIASASGATAPLCGAAGLVITNDSSTPSTVINMTARQAVMQNPAGLVINRSSVSLLTINITTGTVTSTANGLDGEAIPASTATWLYVYVIDNGAAPAGLVSLSSTAPTMPSGYTYKCLMGAMQVDTSANLYRSLQQGSDFEYKITAGSNTPNLGAAPFKVANGVAGTWSLTSPVLTTATVRGNGFCAPPIATRAKLIGNNAWKAGAAANMGVAPSTAWGGTNNGVTGSNGNILPITMITGASPTSMMVQMPLEADTIGWASDAVGGALLCMGSTLAVNAN